MDIRPPTTPAEYRDALLVIERAWKDAFEGIIDEGTLSTLSFTAGEQSMAERFANIEESTDRLDLVAIDGGEIIGSGTLVWGDSTDEFVADSGVELKTLYVEPTRRGEGIGTMILDSLLSDLPVDADRLVLETLTGNDIGISFYRSQGFENVGEHDFTVDGTTYPTVVFERSIDG